MPWSSFLTAGLYRQASGPEQLSAMSPPSPGSNHLPPEAGQPSRSPQPTARRALHRQGQSVSRSSRTRTPAPAARTPTESPRTRRARCRTRPCGHPAACTAECPFCALQPTRPKRLFQYRTGGYLRCAQARAKLHSVRRRPTATARCVCASMAYGVRRRPGYETSNCAQLRDRHANSNMVDGSCHSG
jgi:hypothetical protein